MKDRTVGSQPQNVLMVQVLLLDIVIVLETTSSRELQESCHAELNP